jgi:hypothetical protein
VITIKIRIGIVLGRREKDYEWEGAFKGLGLLVMSYFFTGVPTLLLFNICVRCTLMLCGFLRVLYFIVKIFKYIQVNKVIRKLDPS